MKRATVRTGTGISCSTWLRYFHFSLWEHDSESTAAKWRVIRNGLESDNYDDEKEEEETEEDEKKTEKEEEEEEKVKDV